MLEALVADIQLDFTDENGEPLAQADYIRRAAERSLPLVATDLGVPYRLEGGECEVSPSMPGGHREAWLVRSKVLVCRLLRTQAAPRVDFSSGDKRVSRASEATNYAALEKDLLSDYAALIAAENPNADAVLLRLEAQPLTYRIGSRHHHERQ